MPSSSLRMPRRRWKEFWREGLPAIWASGAMLLCVLAMLVTMLGLTMVRGLGHFWPRPMLQIETANGAYLGPVQEREAIQEGEGAGGERLQLRIGNRDLYGLDFRWFDAKDIEGTSRPPTATVVERQEHGNFHGFLQEVHVGEQVWRGEEAWRVLSREAQKARGLHARMEGLDERYEKRRQKLTELEQQRDAQRGVVDTTLQAAIDSLSRQLQPQLTPFTEERDRIAADLGQREALFEDAQGKQKSIRLDQMVRTYRPNQMSSWSKAGLYVAKIWEFVSADPRESNTEGGIFPALFGTVLMVLLMTMAVVPLGVVAALYLHEYAREGLLLRLVRLAVGNLAGVPSIVFGMFGLAFFVYGIGGTLDRLFFADRLPSPTFGTGGILWASLTLALLTLPVVVVATEEGLSSVPRSNREGSLALGATKWQTLWHVVVPQAVPGILTGVILAISRAAGEVAPLMLTGVVKLAPALALDGTFPYAHLERKFMHLGFHIYDVSMQSPNVEAAKPMVYSTTLLLLLLVVALNATAINVRNRMRRRYLGAAI